MPDQLSGSLLFWIIQAIFAAGAIGSLLFRKSDRLANVWGHGAAILGSLAGLGFAGSSLLGFAAPQFSLTTSFPLLTLTVRMDPLSAFFMVVICLVAFLSSLYALSYVRYYYGKYDLGLLGFFYNVFVASMVLVVTVHNVLSFLIAWEVMSLASYFLVIYEHRHVASLRAGTLYFIMTHAGTAFILLSFLLMYGVTGSLDFETIKHGLVSVSPLTAALIFSAAVIGFGTKAGIIPLHVWLPAAHPAAPSHVSALMSGVMIKTGIYMLIRISLDLVPSGPMWWGTALLIIGAVSALLGVLYALAEHDLKRLLAYHSIENIGIILLGLGGALVFSSAGMNALAGLALIAALFHTLNHATFKALLFMGAGCVIQATHTRNIEEYGGLIRYMPQTAIFFLIGSLAISALPPFNGFFSEWMTFQALFGGVAAFDIMRSAPLILAIGSLALTGGLAAACFVKVFGTTFLARPRSEEIKHAHEASWLSRVAMAILALLTLLLGVGSGTVSHILSSVAASLVGPEAGQLNDLQFLSLNLRDSFAMISLPAITVLLFAFLCTTGILTYLLAGRRHVRVGPTWNCGGDLSPRMEITATGFSHSIITVFKGVLRPSRQTDIQYHDDRLRYFAKATRVTLAMRDIYQPYLYEPLRVWTHRASEQFKRIQSGNVNGYILYIFFTLIALLFALSL